MSAESGVFGYAAGASGTVTPPKGAIIKQIVAHSAAGGTVVIFGGASIPIIATAAPTRLAYRHALLQARNDTTTSGSQDIVFATTDSYYVDWYAPIGAPA